MKIFVAGATGVIGRALLPLLVEEGHQVTAMTRSAENIDGLTAAGASAVVCDAFDGDALQRAIAEARPEIVIHQLTRLPRRYRQLRNGTEPTNRLRTEATRNLVQASVSAGARTIIAQSIAFLYAPGGEVTKSETAQPWTDAPPPFDRTVQATLELERAVTTNPDIQGTVLRYGALYGPGTWFATDGDLANEVRKRRFPIVGNGAGVISFIHSHDAANATLHAVETERTGIYNIVDDRPVSYRDWLPAYARMLGAKPPRTVPAWLARPIGRFAVAAMTGQRGASNDKARAELGWQPEWSDWRDGFATLLDTP